TKYRNSVRTADAAEAAAWVSYCNDASNAERKGHGIAAPLGVRHWQIGNETSYDRNGFDVETAGRKTVGFAEAMRIADPAIQIIGWGDSGWAAHDGMSFRDSRTGPRGRHGLVGRRRVVRAHPEHA